MVKTEIRQSLPSRAYECLSRQIELKVRWWRRRDSNSRPERTPVNIYKRRLKLGLVPKTPLTGANLGNQRLTSPGLVGAFVREAYHLTRTQHA